MKRPRARRSSSRLPGARLGRILALLRLAAAEDGWTAERLARHFGVSRRRIFDDLKLLQREGLPLRSEGRGYRLRGGRLQTPVQISVADALALLQPPGGDADRLHAARVKLAAVLPAPLQRLFGAPERVKPAPHLSPVDENLRELLDRALAENRALRFRYAGIRDRAPRDRAVEPHGLFLRGTGWYLLAWCPELGEFRTFRADRIEQARLTDARFRPQSGFNLERWLEESFDVRHGGDLRAVIEVLPGLTAVMRSEARARRLPFRSTAAGARLEIPVGQIEEVAWWLARFGEGVRVLEPPELRRRLAAIGKKIVELNDW